MLKIECNLIQRPYSSNNKRTKTKITTKNSICNTTFILQYFYIYLAKLNYYNRKKHRDHILIIRVCRDLFSNRQWFFLNKICVSVYNKHVYKNELNFF